MAVFFRASGDATGTPPLEPFSVDEWGEFLFCWVVGWFGRAGCVGASWTGAGGAGAG